MASSKPVRYGKPCMTNLPPKLGRRIFETIRNSKPFDFTRLDRQCARIERRFSKLTEDMTDYEVTEK